MKIFLLLVTIAFSITASAVVTGGCYYSSDGKWVPSPIKFTFDDCLTVSSSKYPYLYVTVGDGFKTFSYLHDGKVVKIDTLADK